MKKLLILFSVVLLSFTANAQNALTPLYSTNVNALIPTIDTVTNTGVKTLTGKIPVSGLRQTVTVSTVLTLASGTGSGTVTLQGSIDGVNYQTVATTQLQGGQTSSYTINNVAGQVCHFVLLNNPFGYYRTTVTGSGTEVLYIKGNFISR